AVGVARGAPPPRASQPPPQTEFEFRAHARGAPLLNQERQPDLGAGLARAVIAEDPDNLGRYRRGFVRLDEDAEGQGNRHAARPHLATDEDVEAETLAFRGRDQGDILRFVMGAVLAASGDGNVELPGEIGKLRIAVAAHDDAIQLEQHGRGVEQFVWRKAGQRTAVDVAYVVHAGLQAVQVDPAQLLPNLRNGLDGEAPQLDLLASRDIEDAVTQAARDLRDGAQLLARSETVGHPDAHHEPAGRRLAEEDPHPLQEVLVGQAERLPTVAHKPGQIFADAQPIAAFGGLVSFDRVIPRP